MLFRRLCIQSRKVARTMNRRSLPIPTARTVALVFLVMAAFALGRATNGTALPFVVVDDVNRRQRCTPERRVRRTTQSDVERLSRLSNRIVVYENRETLRRLTRCKRKRSRRSRVITRTQSGCVRSRVLNTRASRSRTRASHGDRQRTRSLIHAVRRRAELNDRARWWRCARWLSPAAPSAARR